MTDTNCYWKEALTLSHLASFGSGSTLVTDLVRQEAQSQKLTTTPESYHGTPGLLPALSQYWNALLKEIQRMVIVYTPVFSSYQYERLRQGQIRVLSLLPGVQHDRITCQLENINFDTEYSDYTALSYTWGNPNTQKKFPIYINGSMFIVLENLYGALVALRLKDKAYRLWIDAICINQVEEEKKDGQKTEKEIQIPLMGRIYRQAARVVVWLGSSKNDSDFVLDSISQRDVEQMKSSRFFKSFAKLIQREWFSRTWIVQEVALNATPPLLLCGSDRKISWIQLIASFWLVSNMFRSLEEQHRAEDLAIDPIPVNLSTVDTIFELVKKTIKHDKERDNALMAIAERSTVHRLQATRLDYQQPKRARKIPVQRLLSLFRKFSATVAKDKVYGILGLLDEQAAQHFPVNYNKTELEVFQNATQYLLNHEHGLMLFWQFPFPLSKSIRGAKWPSWLPMTPCRFLLPFSTRSSEPKWPSWVPRMASTEPGFLTAGDETWALQQQIRPIHMDRILEGLAILGIPPPGPELDISNGVLTTEGYLVGAIKYTVESQISSTGTTESDPSASANFPFSNRQLSQKIGIRQSDFDACETEADRDVLYARIMDSMEEIQRRFISKKDDQQVLRSLVKVDQAVRTNQRFSQDGKTWLKCIWGGLLEGYGDLKDLSASEIHQALLQIVGSSEPPAADHIPENWKLPQPLPRPAKLLLDAIRQVFCYPKHFFTLDVPVFGVTSSGTREGDVLVFAFRPWFSPVILRPRSDGKFHFVGPAVIPPAMRRGFIQINAGSGLFEMRTFTIV